MKTQTAMTTNYHTVNGEQQPFRENQCQYWVFSNHGMDRLFETPHQCARKPVAGKKCCKQHSSWEFFA